jgi:hypothetical protein
MAKDNKCTKREYLDYVIDEFMNARRDDYDNFERSYVIGILSDRVETYW